MGVDSSSNNLMWLWMTPATHLIRRLCDVAGRDPGCIVDGAVRAGRAFGRVFVIPPRRRGKVKILLNRDLQYEDDVHLLVYNEGRSDAESTLSEPLAAMMGLDFFNVLVS